MKILVLDNYDSFTYNLVQLLRELGFADDLQVHRNDQISLDDVDQFDVILLSPGPGVPSEAGIMPALLQRYAPSKRIMGVCLGHQAIAEAFGAELSNMTEVLHGISSTLRVVNNQEPMFRQLPSSFSVARYHSWTVVPQSVPNALQVTAVDEDGQVLALRHKKYDVVGVQFHPESILTEYGKDLLLNWLKNPSKKVNQWTSYAASLTL